MPAQPLTSAELFVLLNPNKFQGRDVLKLALTELLARRVVTLHQEKRKGFLGITQKVEVLQLVPKAEQQFEGQPSLSAVIRVLRNAGTLQDGASMTEVVNEARAAFSSDFSGFPKRYILPFLVEQGLLERIEEKFLFIFTKTRYRHTPSGETKKQRLEEQMEKARTIPDLIESNPVQAAALMLSLGSAILLVDEIKLHYARISQVMRETPSGGEGAGPDGGDSETTEILPTPEQGMPDWLSDYGLDLSNFDFDLDFDFDFDALDSALDAFDSSFDASADAGDGGDGGPDFD